jgi:antibiotic biosynthesis monooxygenase (ABM) superfamily enzyme
MKTRARFITALKIWIVIYPSITAILYFFGRRLTTLPLYQQTLILTLILVPWVVFAAVPFLDTIIKKKFYDK